MQTHKQVLPSKWLELFNQLKYRKIHQFYALPLTKKKFFSFSSFLIIYPYSFKSSSLCVDKKAKEEPLEIES